ncbi:MAG: flagellar export chaperone FliS [Firmicutes bacterium]|nr:flagellar export chaperone FliS [Bacillota bacterium]
MDPRANQKYKEQSINTMTPEELLLLLFDELVKRLLRAELELKAKNFDQFEESVTRAIDIIQYLSNTLDRSYEVSAGLDKLYEYFIYQLGRAKIGRNQEVLGSVKDYVSQLRDTFRQAKANAEKEPAAL